MAAAQQRGVLEARGLKRKRGLGLKSYVGAPSHVLLGVRISVFWPDDNAFYKVPNTAHDHLKTHAPTSQNSLNISHANHCHLIMMPCNSNRRERGFPRSHVAG